MSKGRALDRVRRAPSTDASQGAARKQPYKAVISSDLATQVPPSLTFKFINAHDQQQEKAPPYMQLVDQDYFPNAGEILLLYAAMLVSIYGEHLSEVWKAIREQSAQGLQEFDEQRFEKPQAGEAIITKIEVKPLNEVAKAVAEMKAASNEQA